MDYDLTRLGSTEFEHMCRSLFQKSFGPEVNHFGDGPDGGREATFDGTISFQSGDETVGWSGHIVLQAKFRGRPLGTSSDQDWLIKQVSKELQDWADPKKRRRKEGRVPDYLIIASNVALSAANGGGADRMQVTIDDLAAAAGIKGWLVWHRDSISSLLDDAPAIRSAYAGLITPGDVLSKLFNYLQGSAAKVGDDLRTHAAQAVVNERFVRLTESGGSGQLTLEQVAFDLPAEFRQQDGSFETRQAVAELIRLGDMVLSHKIAPPGTYNKFVLVGGPGQGKSTLTSLLAQTYRASLLDDDADRHGPRVAEVVRETTKLMQRLGIPTPRNRRWPVRVNLVDYADETATNAQSLISWIARRIRDQGSTGLDAAQMISWFRSWPWLLVLDGLDEVSSPAARAHVFKQVNSLFVEADTNNCDLLTIITTRPQGYEQDLEGPDTLHVPLEPLGKQTALDYAEHFALAHFADDNEQRSRVLTRLKNAADDSSTARLLQTPLQVTIMTLLLEGRERAPKAKHRLFEGYYETIYRRELGKGGPDASLLENHRNDIEFLHAEVGLKLQLKTELADHSGGEIEQSELESMIRARLAKQGFEDPEAGILAERIIRAATTRLVLLVPQRQGVGFEIRSLQEYMAARAITTGPESDLIDRLAIIAPAAHWRHTWLLAVGRVLDTREHLRDSVITMLQQQDADSLNQRLGIGAELAIGLLDEGVASDVPVFRKQLLSQALRIIEIGPRHLPLARVLRDMAEDRPVHYSTINGALERGTTGPLDERAATWSILTDLSSMVGRLPARARQLLPQISFDETQLTLLNLWAAPSKRADSLFTDGLWSKVEWVPLDQFVAAETLELLSDPDELNEAREVLHRLRERRVAALPSDLQATIPSPLRWQGDVPPDPLFPPSVDVREALAVAIDAIPKVSWGAAAAIRSILRRSLERRPVAQQLRQKMNCA